MKNRILCILMTGALAYGNSPALHAQTDVTDTYLVNPSFENSLYSWESDGMVPQTNDGLVNKDQSNYLEKWIGTGNQVGSGGVSQTIPSLPNGVYQLTVAAHNIRQDNSATQTGAYIFADDVRTPVNKADDYSLTFTVVEGRATVGFRGENATGNWLACDNFRLYLIDDSQEAILKELQARIDEATALASDKMHQETAAELQAAIAAAQQQTTAPDDGEIPAVGIRLHEAYEAAQTSAKAYADLQAAIDEALEAAAGEGSGAAELNGAAQTAQAVADRPDATPEELAESLDALSFATLTYYVANPSDTAPTVETDTRHARGNTVAFGRSTITGVSYADLLEHGFCWSTDPEPTILDQRSTEHIEHNGYIYVMHPLKPSTVYYARAYAMTRGHAVGYGDVIKIITIPKGDVSYTYNSNGADEGTNTRIEYAAQQAVTYWNNLTSIRGLHLTINYSPGTPSADCSYGGWMNVGANTGYQKAGTLMHEMGHAIGEGQHGMWWSEILRDSKGIWQGDQGNAVVQFLENDPTRTADGDNAHFGPYGINGSGADDATPFLYIGNSLLNQAFGEDGLPPTGGFATPAYVFAQEDDQKYYLKSESEEYGLYTAYLFEGTNRIVRWKEATADVATANDSAAWYITFDPVSQHYHFRNAATGNYLTYSASSTNGIRTIGKDEPGLTEKFHLLKGRVNVTMGRGADSITTKGYWIAYPDSITDGQGRKTNANGTPDCLTARVNHFTGAYPIELYNDATDQRWLILTAEEAETLEEGAKTNLLDELAEVIAQIREMAQTPHTEDVSGTDLGLEASLNDVWDRAQGARSNEIYSYIQEARAAGMDFLANATPESAAEPFDLTFMMENPAIDDNKGWSEMPTFNYSCCEFWQQTFDFNQTLEGMPAGTYKLTVQAFQRPGDCTAVYRDYQNGINNVNTMLYINTQSIRIKHIASETKKRALNDDDVAVENPKGYLPNSMEGASTYFMRRNYNNELIATIEEDDTDMKLGLRCADAPGSYWTIFDNFHLYYYGSMDEDQVTDIRETLTDGAGNTATDDTGVYNLQGIKVGDSLQGLPKGIYIVNHRKVIVK